MAKKRFCYLIQDARTFDQDPYVAERAVVYEVCATKREASKTDWPDDSAVIQIQGRGAIRHETGLRWRLAELRKELTGGA